MRDWVRQLFRWREQSHSAATALEVAAGDPPPPGQLSVEKPAPRNRAERRQEVRMNRQHSDGHVRMWSR